MRLQLNWTSDVLGLITFLLGDRKAQQNWCVFVCVRASAHLHFYSFLKKQNQFQFLKLKKNTERYLGVLAWFPTITVSLTEKGSSSSCGDGEKGGSDFCSSPFLCLCKEKERACKDLEERETMWKTDHFSPRLQVLRISRTCQEIGSFSWEITNAGSLKQHEKELVETDSFLEKKGPS